MANVKFEDNSIEVKAAIEGAITAWLHEAAGELEAQVKRTSPSDSGQLKGSWDYKVDAGAQKATVGSPLENAIWNEFGTGEYAAKGNGRKDAWYVPVDSYVGAKKPAYNGQVVIVYGKKGKKFYKTNGKKAQHTLEKVFTKNKTKIKKALENKLKGLK